MADSATFLTKSELAGLRELDADGRSLLDSHGTLSAALASRLGRGAASLFAEPVVTRGNGAVATSVSWYARGVGEPVRLDTLDEGERAPLEAELRQRLAEVSTLLGDPEIGPLLGGAFFVPSNDDIWVVDGRPTIANWGLAPEAALRSPAARDEHVARTLGRFVSLGGAPAVGVEAWRDRYRATGGGVGTAAAAGAAGVAAGGVAGASAAAADPAAAGSASGTTGGGAGGGGAGGGGDADPPPAAATPEPRPSRAWIPLLVATVLVALVLAYVSIPGVLSYPPEPPPERVATRDEAALRLQREINRSLEERRAMLESELAERACTEQGSLLPPAGGDDEGSPVRPVSPRAAVPPRPGDLVVPDEDGGDGTAPDADGRAGGDDAAPREPQRLETLLARATVLVIVPAGDDTGIGSGFFVGPDTIVTNRHVVEKRAERVLVTNPAIGRVLPAEVVAETPDAKPGAPDFAVLRVNTGDFTPPALGVSTAIGRLDNVVAAGFPAIVVRSDARFKQLAEGDGSAAPSANMQSGAVTVIQPHVAGDAEVILHSAEISGGNSGGPLVDTCGRVVGVNTFVSAERQGTFRRLNYALHARELRRFLDGAGIAHRAVEGACEPRVAAPPVAQASPPPAAPDATAE